MSDDPTQPPAHPVPAPAEHPPTPNPLKRRYKKPEAATGPEEDPDGEIIILSSLLQNLLARKQGQPAEGGEAEGEVRAKINRFVARGAAPLGAPAAPLPPADPTAPAEPAPAPPALPSGPGRPEVQGPEAMAAIAFPKFEPRAFQPEPDGTGWQRDGSTWGRGILYFAFAGALVLGAFVAGRLDSRRPAAATNTPVPARALAAWSAPQLATLDRAVAADHAGDLAGAQGIVDGLKKDMGANPVLDAYLAMIVTRIGRTNDVEADLSRQIGSNVPQAAVLLFDEAQGFNYARRREFDRSIDLFTDIARLQPFNAVNSLHLGESQRRAGRLSEAVETFRQAAARLPVGALEVADQREYLDYLARLGQVEVGQEADFKPELDQRLADPAPSPYWLLTSAALSLQKGDIPAAVGALQKARATLAPARFTALLNDYFFRAFAHHPEVAPFLTTATPEQQRVRRAGSEFFIDP